MNNVAQVTSLLKDTFTLLALLVGVGVAIFVYFQWAPVVKLHILPSWTDETKQFLILKFEVENKSRVRVQRPKGRIQVLEHTIPPDTSLSHWVPFEQSRIVDTEQPVEWHEPVEIFKSTQEIYPGEVISFERLYHCPQDTIILHIGFQVELDLGFWDRVVTRKTGLWRQTTTCFVVKQREETARRTTASHVDVQE